MSKPLPALALVLLPLSPLLAAEKPEEALKKLEGTWKVASLEMGGKQFTPKEAKMESVIFKGDKLTMMADGKEVKSFGINVDPSKTPPAMDWINLDLKGALPLPCIYSVKDNELRMCFPLLPSKGTDPKDLPKELAKGPQRPESFETDGKPFGLIVAKREKK